MKCPICKSTKVYVTDSRKIQDGWTTQRRKECADCLTRFNTRETIVRESIPKHLLSKINN
jgi:transcriptional regulator NrdR family protein